MTPQEINEAVIVIDPAVEGGDYTSEMVRFGDIWMVADLFTRGRILWLLMQR